MLVVDSSAVVAILFGEPEASALAARLAAEPDKLMSVASYVETGTVLAGRRKADPLQAIADLDAFLGEAGIRLASVDEPQARLALAARIRYGRGFGSPAGLNYGDAFVYALAKVQGAALLFIGNDFGKTDLSAESIGSR